MRVPFSIYSFFLHNTLTRFAFPVPHGPGFMRFLLSCPPLSPGSERLSVQIFYRGGDKAARFMQMPGSQQGERLIFLLLFWQREPIKIVFKLSFGRNQFQMLYRRRRCFQNMYKFPKSDKHNNNPLIGPGSKQQQANFGMTEHPVSRAYFHIIQRLQSYCRTHRQCYLMGQGIRTRVSLNYATRISRRI